MGTSIGGYLSSRFGRRAPCFLAAALFVLDFALVNLLLPDTLPTLPNTRPIPAAPDAPAAATSAEPERSESTAKPEASPKQTSKRGALRLDGFRCAFRGAAGRLLALRLMYGFLVRARSPLDLP